MDASLQPITDALADLDDDELRALMQAANETIRALPGFLSWIVHIADWELNRRTGLDFPLQPPDAAIPPEEDARSTIAALMLRDQLPDGAEARHLAMLFDAIVSVLTGQESLQ